MSLRCACPPVSNLTHNFNRIACVFCLTCTVGLANSKAQDVPTAAAQVASGTVFAASVKKALHADKLQPGDKVDFDSAAPTLTSGRVVVPARAVFHGHVVQSVAAKQDPEQTSRLSIVVDSVTWKDKSLPVCASIAGFGSRKIVATPDQEPFPTTMNTPQVNPDWIKKQAVATNSKSMVDLADHRFGFGLPETVDYQEQSITIRGEQFVKGVTIERGPTGALVLTRKNKSVDLPGGLLVALQQLQVPEGGCPTQSAP